MSDMSIKENQTIVVYGTRILDILDSGAEDRNGGYHAETVIDDPHLLWMPGLTDGHLHTSQQFLRGSLLDEKPVIWKRINVPFEASLTEETMALSARLAGAEMIKSGTTSFVDAGGPHIEAAAEEYLKMGMRGALTWQTTDGAKVPDGLRIDTREALPRLERFHREYHGKGGLLQVYYSVTSLMACTEDLFRTIFLAAREQKVAAECHMNEYASEVLDFIERYGDRRAVGPFCSSTLYYAVRIRDSDGTGTRYYGGALSVQQLRQGHSPDAAPPGGRDSRGLRLRRRGPRRTGFIPGDAGVPVHHERGLRNHHRKS